MGLSLIRFTSKNHQNPTWGVLQEGKISTFDWNEQELGDALLRLTPPFEDLKNQAVNTGLSMSDVTLLSPVTKKSKLICQGLNYSDHSKEVGAAKHNTTESNNLLFIKDSASLCGANDDIFRPEECELLDYEIELGLVIRKSISNSTKISKSDLQDYIAGFVICNDISSRDQMIGATGMQWFQGKSYRTFCPVGPIIYLIEKSEIDVIDDLRLQLWVNGELRQNASTSQLIHKPHNTLTELSNFCDLKPGDCLLTGTPGGVSLNMDIKSGLAILLNMTKDENRRKRFIEAQKKNPAYLKSGDLVEAEIYHEENNINLGKQRNIVKNISAAQ